MQPYVFLPDTLQVEIKLATVRQHFPEIEERVAIVCHGSYEHHLQVETADSFSVKVDICRNGLFLLLNGHTVNDLAECGRNRPSGHDDGPGCHEEGSCGKCGV